METKLHCRVVEYFKTTTKVVLCYSENMRPRAPACSGESDKHEEILTRLSQVTKTNTNLFLELSNTSPRNHSIRIYL